MANQIAHLHECFECNRTHTCEHPECATLLGRQRLCIRCSYIYGWRQKQDRGQDDWSAL